MYVVPSDGMDRSFDVNDTIVNSTAAWESWLSDQTGGRRIRLDTYLGQPDITFARLSQTDAQLAAYGASIRDQIEAELHASGFNAANKIYALFYDGSSTFACGGAAWPPVLPGNVVGLYLRGVLSGVPCLDTYAGPGQPPGYREFSMIHEILHALGFVPTCAPHHVLSGHVSDDPHDLMYAGPEPWLPSTLDTNHDDYYSAGVTGCLDLSQSAFLASPPPPPPPPPSCAASYPTVCIRPPPPDLNCGDIPYTNFTVLWNVPDPDPHHFDGDKDGIGCET